MASTTSPHGDCLELMKTLPDKSVDLFVCDLPYGCLTGGGGKEKTRRRFQNGAEYWDTYKAKRRGHQVSWDIKIDLNRILGAGGDA
jgi:DNA modification methylase